MASIAEVKRGRRSVFDLWTTNTAGKRQRVRLGQIGSVAARQWGEHATHLEHARRSGDAPSESCRKWLSAIGDDLYTSLAKHGLVTPKGSSGPRTLFGFWDWYVGTLASKRRASSIETFDETRAKLAAFFTTDRALSSLTMADAENWANWLRTKARRKKNPNDPDSGLKEATVRLHARNIKHVFGKAVKHKLVPENVFQGLESQSVTGTRESPVPRDVALRVMAELPTAQMRLYFALARFAGLRMPSEGLALTWDRVDWLTGRQMRVYSPKLHRLGGNEAKAWRTVPIDPVLVELFQSVYDAAPENEARVLTLGASNMDNAVERAATRAGVTIWARTFDTLRESCINDWNDTLPGNIVPLIAGHSQKVEQAAYVSVTQYHMDLIARPRVADRVATATHNDDKQGKDDKQKTLDTGHKDPENTGQSDSLALVGVTVNDDYESAALTAELRGRGASVPGRRLHDAQKNARVEARAEKVPSAI